LCANDKVFFPKRGSPWKADVIGQLLRFPVGMHDDKVDVCSLFGRGLEYINAPEVLGNVIDLQTRANVGYERAKRHFGALRRTPRRSWNG
jgi:hypothetical protein